METMMIPKSKFTMKGTEGTGAYVGVAKSARGAVAVREFRPGSFRIRVEPATPKGAEMIGRELTRELSWKQPGDSGQNRFSIMTDAAGLSAKIKMATDALGVGDLKSTDLDFDKALRHVAGKVGAKVRAKVAKATVFEKVVSLG